MSYSDVEVARTLTAIDARWERGYGPTFRELANDLTCSVSSMAHRLAYLAALGLVTWERGIPRTLRRVLDVEPTGGTVDARAATGAGDEAEA